MSTNNDSPPAKHDSSASPKWGGLATIAGVILLAIGAPWFAVEYYDTLILAKAKPDLSMATTNAEAKAQFIREVIIVVAGVIGVFLALWRIMLAEKRLLKEQFANAAELMAKDTAGNAPKPAIAARTAGIYIMADLAMKKPKEFAEQVVKNLIAYIKDNIQITATTPPENSETPANIRILGGDAKTAFSVLSGILGNKAIRKHVPGKLLDFSQANFSGLDFAGISLQYYEVWAETNFSGCDLTHVRFAEGAYMYRANFSDAILDNTILTMAYLKSADFRGANLVYTDMRGAYLLMAKMQGCFMRFAKLERADNGERTNLMIAQLAGANLAGVNLTDAKMDSISNVKHRTDIRGAVFALGTNLTGVEGIFTAEFGETYMVGIIIDKDNESMLLEKAKSMGGKFWFDRFSAIGQVGDRREHINWNLKEYKDGYALAGVLANFAGAPFPEHFENPIQPFLGEKMQENICWKASELNLDNLPENTPEATRKWLKQIKDTHSGFQL